MLRITERSLSKVQSATEFPCLLTMEVLHEYHAKSVLPPQYVAERGRHSGLTPLTRKSGMMEAQKIVARFRSGKAERKKSTRLFMCHDQTDNPCATPRRIYRGIIAPVLRKENAIQAMDSVMGRLWMPTDVCTFTRIPPIHPDRSVRFHLYHCHLDVLLLDQGERFGSLSKPRTPVFRSDSVHQQHHGLRGKAVRLPDSEREMRRSFLYCCSKRRSLRPGHACRPTFGDQPSEKIAARARRADFPVERPPSPVTRFPLL